MAPSFYVLDDEAFEKQEQKYSIFENRVNYVCWDLCHAGLIERTPIGFYVLSSEGCQAAGRDDYVDRDYLWDIPEFQDYFLSHMISTDCYMYAVGWSWKSLKLSWQAR